MLVLVLAACTDSSPPSPPPGTTTETGAPTGSTPTSPSTTETGTEPTFPPGPALVFDGKPPANILMISIDTTRRDEIGLWSSEPSRTEFIDSLASSGVRFEDHQQCSNWTFASTSCTLAGRMPEETGFVPSLTEGLGSGDNLFPDAETTLAERLRDAGYYTILVTGNGWLSETDNNAQGYTDVEQPIPNDATSIVTTGSALLGDAIDRGATKWFVHLHLMEPHAAYNPPDQYLAEEKKLDPLPASVDLSNQFGHYAATAKWPNLTPTAQANLEAHLWARYRGEIAYLDDQLATLWPTLESQGTLDDTLVVFWTDHGEQMFERGNQSHAYNLNAEENNGVWFVWANNLAARRWTGPTHAVDVVPTVLAAVGLKPDAALMGTVAGLAAPDRVRFATTDSRLGLSQSVTKDGWKLSFNFSGVVRLYDRNTDPQEQVDVLQASPNDPHLKELWALLLPRVLMLHDLLPDRDLTFPPGLPTTL